ncbi:Protein fmp32, mitochondrial [Exophiala oligosperma]
MSSITGSKPVAVPRFLLPRLTWTTTRATASLVEPVPRTVHTARPSSSLKKKPTPSSFRQGPASRSIHTTAAATISSGPVAPSKSSSPSSRSPRAWTVRPLPVDSAPIRHNGVYVATFKTARRAFSATAACQKDHHFDTLKFVQRLKDEGFSEEQAVAMMRVLNDVIEESIQNLTRTMVLKEDAERSTYTQKVDFAKLRSELSNADSTEAQLTRSSHERLSSDLAKLNARLRDEIGRTQASVRLDLNLEKGRIREEANGQEMRIKETEARIEQEVAGLRERVEAVKFSTLQWLMGVCTGTAALILGAWRLLM